MQRAFTSAPRAAIRSTSRVTPGSLVQQRFAHKVSDGAETWIRWKMCADNGLQELKFGVEGRAALLQLSLIHI